MTMGTTTWTWAYWADVPISSNSESLTYHLIRFGLDANDTEHLGTKGISIAARLSETVTKLSYSCQFSSLSCRRM
jgi:hypothetical protein